MTTPITTINPGHTSQNLLECLKLSTDGFNSVLELGCMFGDMLHACSCKLKVGVDIFKPYLEMAEVRYPPYLFIHRDIRLIRYGQFDVTLFCDVLEHFEKDEALSLLDRHKKTSKRIILFIPIGHHPQNSDSTGYGNAYQAHLSTWEYGELENLGFNVARWENYHKDPLKDSRAAFCIWDNLVISQ